MGPFYHISYSRVWSESDGRVVCLCVCVCRYSSPYEAGHQAISHLTALEPENDPRHMVYLWLVEGPVASAGTIRPSARCAATTEVYL